MPRASRHFRQRLRRDGFVLIKGLATKNMCESVLKNTFSLLCRFSNIPSWLKEKPKPWEIQEFQDQLRRLRQSDPKLFGAMYDSALSSVALARLLTDEMVAYAISYLLEVPPSSLSLSGHVQRMDPPNDIRNLYDWHQDQSYYPQNRNGMRGLIAWIPLMDLALNGGALVVAKGSHRHGFIKTEAKKENDITSIQHEIPQEIAEKYEAVQFPMEAGDALIMYMATMHKSSDNETNRFRFVAIGRYHTATADDFIPYRYPYSYNEYIKNMLAEKGHDVSDIVSKR